MSGWFIGMVLLGGLLGMRWKVLVLVPVTLMILLSVGGAYALNPVSATQSVIDAVVAMVGLQVGYICAFVLRALRDGVRSRRQSTLA